MTVELQPTPLLQGPTLTLFLYKPTKILRILYNENYIYSNVCYSLAVHEHIASLDQFHVHCTYSRSDTWYATAIYISQILTNHFSHILELGLPPLSESWEQPVCLQVIIIEGDEWLGNGTQVQVQLLF